MIEMAFILPLAVLFLYGILSAGYLLYQNAAVHDGATAGARAASVETSLAVAANSGGPCGPNVGESGTPLSIEQAVAKAAPSLSVNSNPLCFSDATHLTQSPQVANAVNITVTCTPACAAPVSTVGVSLVYATHGITQPFNFTYTMHATSTDPILVP